MFKKLKNVDSSIVILCFLLMLGILAYFVTYNNTDSNIENLHNGLVRISYKDDKKQPDSYLMFAVTCRSIDTLYCDKLVQLQLPRSKKFNKYTEFKFNNKKIMFKLVFKDKSYLLYSLEDFRDINYITEELIKNKNIKVTNENISLIFQVNNFEGDGRKIISIGKKEATDYIKKAKDDIENKF